MLLAGVGYFVFNLTGQLAGQIVYQGVTLDSPTGSSVRESILDMQQVGVNTVSIHVPWNQASPRSTSLSSANGLSVTEHLTSIEPTIDQIHSLGMEVLLQPRITVDSGELSIAIDPANTSTWFDSYTSMLTDLTQFAEQKQVALVSVGYELNLLEAPERESDWRNVVLRLRGNYSGRLTYASDYTFDQQFDGGFEDLPWWDALDFVGINAYFPLTADLNAESEQLDSAWIAVADEIEDWRGRVGNQQNVILTEVGYRSVDGGAAMPRSDGRGGRVDLQEQADAYSALLTALEARPWWGGVFFQTWNADVQAGGLGDSGFTPQHKPAESVLAEHYGGRSNFFVVPSLLASWEQSFEQWRIPGEGPSATGGLRLEDQRGVVEGNGSLAVPASTEMQLVMSKTWTLEGSNAYSLFKLAAEHPADYVLELDVTYDLDQVPDGAVANIVFLLDDVAGTTTRSVQVDLGQGSGDTTARVTLPLSDIPLRTNSLWYELQLGTDNNFSTPALFDNLRLRSTVVGDITNDIVVDANDIDALSDALRRGDTDEQFDANRDGIISQDDRLAWMAAVGTTPGDLDLNGSVDFPDFLVLSSQFGKPGNWSEGDATGDRLVNFADFLLLSSNFGETVAGIAVPEPDTSPLLYCAMFVILMSSIRRRSI